METTKNYNGWVLTEWFGNTNMGIVSYLKMIKNPYNYRNTKVWVYQNGENYSFCVNAGPTSDYSYTGGFNNKPVDISQACDMVDILHINKKLFR